MSGEWGLGVSTPPICELLEGEDGETSDWYDTTERAELDGNQFYQEFTGAPASSERAGLDSETAYYVRCRVSRDTGNTVEATAPIEGEVPAT